MEIRTLQTPDELATYDQWVRRHPQGSLWQSLDWKKYQEALGRETRIYGAVEGQKITASALAIIDRTVGGFSMWDIPRGPLSATNDQRTAVSLLEEMERQAKKGRCLALFSSPALPLSRKNWKETRRHEQPEASRILDLTLSEDQLLAQMHQKGRYNIRVAQKHDVRVEESRDINAFFKLLKTTGERDAFGIKPKKHYETFLASLPGSFLLLAHAGTEAIAGLLGVTWNGRGIYYYGASSYEHRALMAPYLLQWEAMKLCKALGCASYDLLGIAPPSAGPNHPWAGVGAFKEKFGGTVVLYPPEQELRLRPVLKGLLGLKRRILG